MRTSCDRVIGRSSDRNQNPGWFRTLLHLILAILREIFDENAYERFLQRTDSVRSVESYRAFLRENEAVTARKPRCC